MYPQHYRAYGLISHLFSRVRRDDNLYKFILRVYEFYIEAFPALSIFHFFKRRRFKNLREISILISFFCSSTRELLFVEFASVSPRSAAFPTWLLSSACISACPALARDWSVLVILYGASGAADATRPHSPSFLSHARTSRILRPIRSDWPTTAKIRRPFVRTVLTSKYEIASSAFYRSAQFYCEPPPFFLVDLILRTYISLVHLVILCNAKICQTWLRIENSLMRFGLSAGRF